MLLTWVLRVNYPFFPDMKKQPVRNANAYHKLLYVCNILVYNKDVEFLLKVLSENTNTPQNILEVACGSGRIKASNNREQRL